MALSLSGVAYGETEAGSRRLPDANAVFAVVLSLKIQLIREVTIIPSLFCEERNGSEIALHPGSAYRFR
jgi:hypothetical protein